MIDRKQVTDAAHPHADVIIAWARGKPVQWYSSMENAWKTWTTNNMPGFSEDTSWRIKPQSVRYRVALFHDNGYWTCSYKTEESAENSSHHPFFVRWVTDWQEIDI